MQVIFLSGNGKPTILGYMDHISMFSINKTMKSQYRDQMVSIFLKCLPSLSEIFMKAAKSAAQILLLNYMLFGPR